jgi:hypothetical protein
VIDGGNGVEFQPVARTARSVQVAHLRSLPPDDVRRAYEGRHRNAPVSPLSQWVVTVSALVGLVFATIVRRRVRA